MGISHTELQVEAQGFMAGAVTVPPATEADFDNSGRALPVSLYRGDDSDSYAYYNAETCPDCSGGMIRQGRCCVCPSCGFESCVV